MRKNILLIVILVVASCTVKPVKIDYGKDACHFCKMNIVDKNHAVQIVSNKGKHFNYDAVECMLFDLENHNINKIELFLVTDYKTPEKLIDAKQAYYIISDAIKSPMSANLAAFESKSIAEKFVEENGGKLYNWSEINEVMK